MKVLCIGESSIETTSVINEVLVEGNNYVLEEKTKCGSGSAGNIAYLLGKWGVETYIASMLGSDDDGNKIKKEYETIGVKNDYLETSYDKSTTSNLVIVNNTNKNNTKFKVTDNANLKKYTFMIEPDIIVTDGIDFNATTSACDKYPNAKSFLKVNKSNNEIMELCKYVKYIIFNKETAEIISNLKIDYNESITLVNVYNKLKQKFSKAEIIITLGERGSVYAINSQVKIMPTIKVDIVDTNGSGDAFAGAFVYAMGREFGLEKSICYATIAGALSTTKLTSRMSFPSLTEVSSYYDNKFGPQNNPNKTEGNNEVDNTENNPSENTENNDEESSNSNGEDAWIRFTR